MIIISDPIDALYARQSLDKKESISIENQVSFCKYETHGNPYELYIDKGFSGKNTKRPAFTRMMEDIRQGRIRRVIVYKLDRISRSILDFSNMMEQFQKYHVEFISSTEKFDTSSPIGNAMLNICIVFAQLERETIQKRISDAYYTKSQKGYFMGGRIPYGFQLEKKIRKGQTISCFLPEPEEAAQIQLIYQLYSEPDATLRSVLSHLNSQNITKKRGAPWCVPRLSELLRNPVYVKADPEVYDFLLEQHCIIQNPPSDFLGIHGVFLYNSSTSKNATDLPEKTAVLAPHEGIIDASIWLKCQHKPKHRRHCSLR